jgi:hypothetical protein
VPPPPPPPPPRLAGISAAGSVPAGFSTNTPPATYDDELKALFIGDAWGGEPVWYYFDRSDQVQGPFSAREMIGWVSSGMLLEETRMCGADAKLGVSNMLQVYLLCKMLQIGFDVLCFVIDCGSSKVVTCWAARSACPVCFCMAGWVIRTASFTSLTLLHIDMLLGVLQIPPGRNLYQPLSGLLLAIRHDFLLTHVDCV